MTEGWHQCGRQSIENDVLQLLWGFSLDELRQKWGATVTDSVLVVAAGTVLVIESLAAADRFFALLKGFELMYCEAVGSFIRKSLAGCQAKQGGED
jgi:hypothetical protein